MTKIFLRIFRYQNQLKNTSTGGYSNLSSYKRVRIKTSHSKNRSRVNQKRKSNFFQIFCFFPSQINCWIKNNFQNKPIIKTYRRTKLRNAQTQTLSNTISIEEGNNIYVKETKKEDKALIDVVG